MSSRIRAHKSPGQSHAVRRLSCTLRWSLSAWAAMLVCSSAGCTLVENLNQSFRHNSVFNDAAVKMRNRSMSSKSWHHHKNRFCNEPCLSDFCAGYRQGYEDVAAGGTGCTPNFPPRDYWGWQHQSAEGQRKVSAWFAGYPHGARAAEEAGVGNWSQLQMSSNLQSQYVTAGLLPNQGHAVYPITQGGQSAPLGGPTPAAPPQMPMDGVPMGAQLAPGPFQNGQPTGPTFSTASFALPNG